MKKKNTKQSAMIWTPPSPNLPDIKNNQKENNYNLPNDTKPLSQQITEKYFTNKTICCSTILIIIFLSYVQQKPKDTLETKPKPKKKTKVFKKTLYHFSSVQFTSLTQQKLQSQQPHIPQNCFLFENIIKRHHFFSIINPLRTF